MKLEDTVKMMLSDDEKEQLKAEYLQLVIRLRKLLDYWAKLDDRVTAEGGYILSQITAMKDYQIALSKRLRLVGLMPSKLDNEIEEE